MGFLSPWFLAGLAAVAIPVYFHLLRQQRANPRPFSSLMFFERSTQSSIRHRRLRYLALLAARVALLALIALAFAGPYILRPVASSGERSLLLIVVDRSFSMRAADRIERARQAALSILSARRPAAPAQVAALDAQLHLLTEPTASAAELAAAVRSIEATDERSSFGELARAVRALADSSGAVVELNLVSDMQQSSMPPGFSDLALGPKVRLRLHPVAEAAEPNFAVESVVAPAAIFDPAKVRVQATVSGSNSPAARLAVSLVAAGKVLETRRVDVPENGRATVEFHSLAVPYGFTRCEVRLDPADRLRGDDRFQFAVERADPRPLLFVHEARDNRSLLYFRSALESAQTPAFRLQPVTADQCGALDPARFPVIVLSDVEALPAAFEQRLRKHVRDGGAVLIAAGPATARRGRAPVLEEKVLESRYAARAGERFQTAASADPAHPSLRFAVGWETVKFYQAVPIEPAGGRVVARLADGTPLLVDRALGEGRLVYFASTFDNIANDFPLHPSFVPFVEQTVNSLGRVQQRTSSVVVGSFVELRSSAEQGQAVEVIGPEEGRALSLEEAARAQSFQLRREGFYELRRASNRNEMVAVNADRRESDLAPIPQETLALWENTAEGNPEAAVEAGAVQRPWNLWWHVMLLVLAAALAESLVAVRYLSVEREVA
mgnify:CR=1 FL=1